MNKRLEILNTVLLVVILVIGVTMMLAVNKGGQIGARTANPTTLDADEWTQINDLAVDDLEVGDDATITDDLAVGGDVTVAGNMAVTGSVYGDYKLVDIAATDVYATTTLTAADSGNAYLITASGTTITLPAVTNAGAHFMFIIDGAVDTGNVAVTSAEGDNVEGSIIVAGAVVDCDAADVLTFVADGENIGDFVEVVSTGTYWVPLQSSALTASKLTCSG